MQNEQKKEALMPVDRLSYSSMVQLLRNPLIFKLKYILGVYDGKTSMSAMIGKAGHKAIQVYYGGDPEIATPADRDEARSLAMDTGLKYLDQYSDVYINYGKTGSREKMLETYTKAMNFYFSEEPEYNNILLVEEKLNGEMKTIDGDVLPLPGVGIPDIVEERKDGSIDVIDMKFVKSFTDYENEDGQPHEDYVKIIQSQFLWHLLRSVKGINATRMVFREIKTTENKPDKETGLKANQIRDYVIPFNHEPYRIIFYNLYKDAVNFLKNPDSIYLPNLSDMLDGEQAGLLYAQGLIGSDMSDVEVMHKVKDVAFVSKKFISSRLDRVENKHLNPEEKIKLRLAEFGIPVEPVETKVGSSVTQYRFKVSAGIRMSTILKHEADIALAIEAEGSIKIIAPIPGTQFIGVEVPNKDRKVVTITEDLIEKGTLSLPIGIDIHGKVVKEKLNEMPHLLIAGTTGSGKSILLHTILTTLTKQMTADNLSLILIDPKRVELTAFKNVPHLKGMKILHKYEESFFTLKATVDEMENRYKILEESGCRDIKEYNERKYKHELVLKGRRTAKKVIQKADMNYIVVVIDEFADLMMQGKIVEKKKKKKESLQNAASRVAVEVIARRLAKQGIRYNPGEQEDENASVEELICRLAQMARAVGIHLIIATQRPSVDVITGLIKANFPTRIALTTSSATDSKVILGEEGAEKLNGKGDMIFHMPGRQKTRLQGFYKD